MTWKHFVLFSFPGKEKVGCLHFCLLFVLSGDEFSVFSME